MQRLRTISTAALVAGLLWAPSLAVAQPHPAGAPPKTIGSTVKTQMVPSLIVMNARGATLQGGKLTLTGVAPNSIVFADRPVRSAGHALTSHLLEEWSENADDGFAKNPPNATVSVVNKDASAIRDAVVVLKSPQMDGDRLTFDVQVLEGDLTGADGPAAVFIDIIGLPATPLSFAGAARRTAYRMAWYAGAAGAAVPYAYPPSIPPYYHPYYRPWPY